MIMHILTTSPTHIHVYTPLTSHTHTHTHTQNWIRNRRRPTAVRSAEKLAEKMALGNVPQSIPALTSIATAAPPLTAITQGESSSHHTHAHLHPHCSSPVGSGYSQIHSLPPDPKRIFIDCGKRFALLDFKMYMWVYVPVRSLLK